MRDILNNKYYHEESVFLPENLLREARRQKKLKNCGIPKVCVLDPDGDIVRYVKQRSAKLNTCWACYHSELYDVSYKDLEFGIIGCAVGASYAVLLAEQLFISGCDLLISVTSAGKLNDNLGKDYILISETIRDEGTSYHYLPPEQHSSIQPDLLLQLERLCSNDRLSVQVGKSWTTMRHTVKLNLQ